MGARTDTPLRPYRSERIYTTLDHLDRLGGLKGQLRVVAVPWKGRFKAHVREYYLAEDGSFRPDRRGVTFSLEELEAVHHAIGLMIADRDRGRFDLEPGQEGGGEAARQEQEPEGEADGQVPREG